MTYTLIIESDYGRVILGGLSMGEAMKIVKTAQTLSKVTRVELTLES